MEIVEMKCENCGKAMYVQEECIQEKMFCTLRCLDSFTGAVSSKGIIA